MKRIYLDHAAATPLDPRVRVAMEPYETEEFGNPGGLYREGRRAKDAIDSARATVASALNCATDEIIFTSGGTEGDVLALVGAARAHGDKGPPSQNATERASKHIVSTAIEHHAVLHTLDALKKEGFEITLVEVEPNGIVDPQKIEAALRPDTILVSVMYANNEIGTIQPIAEIAKIVKKHGAIFHTDACQAAGYLDLDVKRLNVDLMTINGTKIYGPKGSGALFVRRGIKIKPLFFGGSQESRRRPGTENVPAIVGFAEALNFAQSEREAESRRMCELRDYFIKRLTTEIPKTVLNGDAEKRLPNNVNVSILDIEGEATILYLDANGIACSTGSACTSESLDPSHVILALGKPYEYAHASIRFSLGRETQKADIDYVMDVLPDIVDTLRKISPVSIDMNATSMSHPEAFAGEGLRVKAKAKSYKL
ncbi:MAG: cysteine desulfurase [Candidatus Ryanbacteria bacterium]|nr:cysteine desulfurase [Candidatus Ryanbacteria bacterium]